MTSTERVIHASNEAYKEASKRVPHGLPADETAVKVYHEVYEAEMEYPTPKQQLASINGMLDVLDIPYDYPDSKIECTTRERVNMLVQFCVARGIKWQFEEVY